MTASHKTHACPIRTAAKLSRQRFAPKKTCQCQTNPDFRAKQGVEAQMWDRRFRLSMPRVYPGKRLNFQTNPRIPALPGKALNISPLPVHFALINRRDGFFLTGRYRQETFEWKSLEKKTLLADHGAQPLAMPRCAVHYNGAGVPARRGRLPPPRLFAPSCRPMSAGASG